MLTYKAIHYFPHRFTLTNARMALIITKIHFIFIMTIIWYLKCQVVVLYAG